MEEENNIDDIHKDTYDLVINLGYKEGEIISFHEHEKTMEFQGRILAFWSDVYAPIIQKKGIECPQNIHNSYAAVCLMMKLYNSTSKFSNSTQIVEYAQTEQYYAVPMDKILGKVQEVLIYNKDDVPYLKKSDINHKYDYSISQGVMITSCIISRNLQPDKSITENHINFPEIQPYLGFKALLFPLTTPKRTIMWYHFNPYAHLSEFFYVIKEHIFDPFLDPSMRSSRPSRGTERGSNLWRMFQIYMKSIFTCDSSNTMKNIILAITEHVSQIKQDAFLNYYCDYPFTLPFLISEENEPLVAIQIICLALFQIYEYYTQEYGIGRVMFYLETLKNKIEDTMKRGLQEEGRIQPIINKEVIIKIVDDDDNTINSSKIDDDDDEDDDDDNSKSNHNDDSSDEINDDDSDIKSEIDSDDSNDENFEPEDDEDEQQDEIEKEDKEQSIQKRRRLIHSCNDDDSFEEIKKDDKLDEDEIEWLDNQKQNDINKILTESE